MSMRPSGVVESANSEASAEAIVTPHEDAERSLEGLRSALGALVAAVPGNVRKAADLQRCLGLDAALGWAVFKVATAEEPLASVQYVPKPASMARFLRAAERSGVPKNLIERAELAFSKFDETVQTHADDREAFDAMIAGGEIDLKDRRAAFRLNSRLWGEHCKVHLSAIIVFPGEQSRRFDAVFLRGFIGLTKTRTGIAGSRVMRVRLWPSDGEKPDEREQQLISPLTQGSSVQETAGILTEFGSGPAPTVRRFTDENQFECTEIRLDQLGKTGATTYFVAEKFHNFMRAPLAKGVTDGFSSLIREPTEVYVRDFIVHQSVWDGPPPSAKVYGSLDPVDLTRRPVSTEDNRLDCGERIIEPGRGLDAIHVPDVPRYADLAERVFSLAGLNPDEFRIFRCRLEYPILHSVLRVAFMPPPAQRL